VIAVRRCLGAIAGGAGLNVAGSAVVGLAVLACGASGPTLELDGWATGALLQDCSAATTDGDCARLVAPTLARLDDGRERRSVKVYEEGPYIDPSGTARRLDRGENPIVIVVVTYTDGSRRAAGVYCPATVEGQAPPACTIAKPPFD
jgi:hypothetical protein